MFEYFIRCFRVYCFAKSFTNLHNLDFVQPHGDAGNSSFRVLYL